MVRNTACNSNTDEYNFEVRSDEENIAEVAFIAETRNSSDGHSEHDDEEKIAATVLLSFKKQYEWYLDRGATRHRMENYLLIKFNRNQRTS